MHPVALLFTSEESKYSSNWVRNQVMSRVTQPSPNDHPASLVCMVVFRSAVCMSDHHRPNKGYHRSDTYHSGANQHGCVWFKTTSVECDPAGNPSNGTADHDGRTTLMEYMTKDGDRQHNPGQGDDETQKWSEWQPISQNAHRYVPQLPVPSNVTGGEKSYGINILCFQQYSVAKYQTEAAVDVPSVSSDLLSQLLPRNHYDGNNRL